MEMGGRSVCGMSVGLYITGSFQLSEKELLLV